MRLSTFSILVTGMVMILAGKCAGNRRPCTEFVQRSGNHLTCGGDPFYAVGVNAYYLQSIAAIGDTDHVNEVLGEAASLGCTTVRAWAFFDCADTSTEGCIQWAPGKLNERGLRALDYVIAKASVYSMRLVLALVNNWEEYGGMNQYVSWYAQLHPPEAVMGGNAVQRIVYGEPGRYYHTVVSGTLTHDDFYTNATIKGWYKDYIAAIVHRTNSFTGVEYRADPSIFAWELANEPTSSDKTGDIVAAWVDEMSSYLKSIDGNHLIGVGEEGFDCSPDAYQSPEAYNGQTWLFDGTEGCCYSRNISMANIDLAGIHLYPEGWNLSLNQALTWLDDHQRIANSAGKPLIVGEVGIKTGREEFYRVFLSEAYYQNNGGVLLWQYVYPGRPDYDGFSFSCPRDSALCDMLEEFVVRIESRGEGGVRRPVSTVLYPNYPNPFNQQTIIQYDLPEQSFVRLELYSVTGQRVAVLFEGEESQGTHLSVLDGARYASGIYVVRLTADGASVSRKVSLAR